MKIPRLGLQLMSVIAKHGENVTDATISREMGLPIKSVRDRITYYKVHGILRVETRARAKVRIMRTTQKGYDWVFESQQRLALFNLPRRPKPRALQPAPAPTPRPPMRKPEHDFSPDAKMRKCLGPDCGREFRSEWAGQRICGGCKSTLTWRGSQCEDYMVRYG